MNEEIDAALIRVLQNIEGPVVAVSGGVDSVTLAAFAHRLRPGVTMIHAISPAVPESATRRVRSLVESQGWDLQEVDAREFEDPHYLANPANRCFFCKTNLYGTMARVTSGTLLSGTNLDDLSDWRPGLKAAEDHKVRHPFVEARFAKADVRALASRLGLRDIAELPASPCLSSRVETGIPIAPETLKIIDRVETGIREKFSLATVRLRRRAAGFVLEIDAASHEAMAGSLHAALAVEASAIAGEPVTLAPYRRGSAFLRENA